MSRESIANEVIFAKLPIELLLQIFYLSRNFQDAVTLSKTCKYLRVAFRTQSARIYLALAPRCLPCYEEAMALAQIQIKDEVEGQHMDKLAATLRRNHQMVFKAARHSLARENAQSEFRLAFDRPTTKPETDRLPDELDEPCRLALATDYAINRLLLTPVEERKQVMAEMASDARQHPVSVKNLRESLLLKVHSYSTVEMGLYFTNDHAVWYELLMEILSRTADPHGYITV